MFRNYYLLTKPGIIRGNLITATAGFLFAAGFGFSFLHFFLMLLGLGCVIACGCVFNNFIDRRIDKKMKRTKDRALVIRAIPNKNALLFGSFLGVLGVIFLFLINMLTAAIALAGLFFYAVIYSIFKRRSVYGTLIGSISGAAPPVVGYISVVNRLDLGALLLFLVLIFWQMPHFYSIAIYRMSDYKRAGIPLLPIVSGINITKVHIIAYILGFLVVGMSFNLFQYKGDMYAAVVFVMGLLWLGMGIKGFFVKDNVEWAKRMFSLSLVVLLVWSIFVSI